MKTVRFCSDKIPFQQVPKYRSSRCRKYRSSRCVIPFQQVRVIHKYRSNRCAIPFQQVRDRSQKHSITYCFNSILPHFKKDANSFLIIKNRARMHAREGKIMLKTALATPSISACSEPPKSVLLEVPIRSIHLRHDRPRRILEHDAIDGMMASLSTTGQMQAIGVRRHGNGWILIYGYLRLQAVWQLGWETIRAMEYPESGNAELIDLVLWASENLHQSAPKLDELAIAVSRFADAGMSLPAIATALGKPEHWVEAILNIARDSLARRMIEMGRLTEVEAWIAFIKLSPQIRKSLLDSTELISLQRCILAQVQKIPDAKSRKSKILQTQDQGDWVLDSLTEPDGGKVNQANIRNTGVPLSFF